ncbi:LytR/AlgR family response regulator transcription factor [Moheibacter lacus]|uniref:Response regulator transcription factor n=1 Tax=Moheibacter lacus TaxID=2745851 RepID=A0A838ZS32_9FLAO|nr:LytTR family DNA-binding domain-containing protein [Moheibacter lacus]MBA5629872.1 response regulator transcription factor [Moheibacter lacus]
MKKIKTLAVDDEAPALRRLVKMIENHPKLELIETARNSIEAKEKILKFNPDLVLLDIQLKDATAFELLLEIQNSCKDKIIFCTAYDQYAIKAFDFQAIDYLLKPYSEERFQIAIDRILKQNEKTDLTKMLQVLAEKSKSSEMLKIPEGNKCHFIHTEFLYYVQAEGYYAQFVLKNEKKLIRISLKNLEEILPESFIRINKSIIVNKTFISEMVSNKSSTKITMPDKMEFDVSEKYLKYFQSKIL